MCVVFIYMCVCVSIYMPVRVYVFTTVSRRRHCQGHDGSGEVGDRRRRRRRSGRKEKMGGGWGKKRREINQVGAICGRWACGRVISNPVTLARLTKRTASAARR